MLVLPIAQNTIITRKILKRSCQNLSRPFQWPDMDYSGATTSSTILGRRSRTHAVVRSRATLWPSFLSHGKPQLGIPRLRMDLSVLTNVGHAVIVDDKSRLRSSSIKKAKEKRTLDIACFRQVSVHQCP